MAKVVAIYVAAADDFDEIGRVRLDDAGRVAIEGGARVNAILESTYVPDLSDPARRRLFPEHGQAYLDALPIALHGSYLRADELE